MINHHQHEVAIIALSVFLSDYREALISSARYLSGSSLEKRTRSLLADLHVWDNQTSTLVADVRSLHCALKNAMRERANEVTFTSEPLEAEFANTSEIKLMMEELDDLLAKCESSAGGILIAARRRAAQ